MKEDIKFALIVKRNGRYVQQKLWTPEEFEEEMVQGSVAFPKIKIDYWKMLISKKYRININHFLLREIAIDVSNQQADRIYDLVRLYKKPVKGGKR